MARFLPRRFRHDETGSLSIEAVFALPLLVWAIIATFVFWDAFKTLNVSQKATYTVADMLSRETDPIDDDYIAAMHEMFDFLAGSAGQNAIRVSVVTKITDPVTGIEQVALVWSEGADIPAYTDLTMIETRLPEMAVGEQLIVVESEQEWQPAFAVGLAAYRFREVALARPRFSPQLVFDDGLSGAAS
ncbi:pilus assembly protein [Silicimonas algicola]|uniref:Flp pilus assembly protein TadG n=1 Tax=Silicimonas algicola TaxID=1826607 RepID=A0A316FXI3_9RHOB|nr:pilus assembly protein [Silicimonas algicola]AZQ66780.1 pilus assembly protein [Silicimonas algicola]PWK53103.1 hypothetical protein C8D95_1145 [Silicimonas algicola]